MFDGHPRNVDILDVVEPEEAVVVDPPDVDNLPVELMKAMEKKGKPGKRASEEMKEEKASEENKDATGETKKAMKEREASDEVRKEREASGEAKKEEEAHGVKEEISRKEKKLQRKRRTKMKLRKGWQLWPKVEGT